MENTHVVSAESFAQYKSLIGIILYSTDDQQVVNFHTGDRQLKVNRDDLSTPTLEAIEKAISRNEELKEIAFENNLIELHTQDVKSYMNYVSTYN